MDRGTASAASRASLQAHNFDGERAPVALRLDAASLLSSDCLLARELESLQALAAASSHLSIRLVGPTDARTVLADRLLEALPADTVRLWQQSPGAAEVIARCPLLSAERGDCAWSRVGLLVPPESAWIAVDVDLPVFARASGRVDRTALGEHLDETLEAIDRCYDSARWPTPRMQQDAWENRRVAIRPLGLASLYADGDYSLSALHQLTGWISARLQACSHRLAQRQQPLPSIRHADPAGRMPHGPRRDEWRRRWLDAVAASAVRHRNLLALSADSLVLRERDSRRYSYDLLSLLKHADTVAIAHTALDNGVAEEALRYRRRLAAALQQRHGLDQIAKLV